VIFKRLSAQNDLVFVLNIVSGLVAKVVSCLPFLEAAQAAETDFLLLTNFDSAQAVSSTFADVADRKGEGY
jgi:hypothetical protein